MPVQISPYSRFSLSETVSPAALNTGTTPETRSKSHCARRMLDKRDQQVALSWHITISKRGRIENVFRFRMCE